MFRNSALCVFVAATVIMAGALSAYAQEPETVSGQDGHDSIIDEVLDQIEQSLDPQAAPEGPPMDLPVATDDEKELVEPGDPDDVIETPDIELEEAVGTDNLQPIGVPQTKTIPLLHAEASSIVEALNEMKSPAGEIVYHEGDGTLTLKDTSEAIAAMENFIKEADIPLETEVFRLEYVNVQDILGNIKTALSNNIGQAHVDKKAGAIVVTDTPSAIGKIKELIRAMDRADRDVMIKAKVLQIILNDEHPQGVDWEAIVSDFQKKSFTGFDGKATDALSLGTISQEDYDILLDALDTVGVIRTVFDGDIKTENKTEVVVRVLPDLSEDMQQSRDIRIRLVPDIKKGLVVEASLWLELDGKGFAEEGGNQKGIMVRAKDGSTIIIGSLFEDVMVPSMWKIPLLGDLPLLGFVFRNEGEKLHKAEVITFLTVKTAEKRNGEKK